MPEWLTLSVGIKLTLTIVVAIASLMGALYEVLPKNWFFGRKKRIRIPRAVRATLIATFGAAVYTGMGDYYDAQNSLDEGRISETRFKTSLDRLESITNAVGQARFDIEKARTDIEGTRNEINQQAIRNEAQFFTYMENLRVVSGKLGGLYTGLDDVSDNLAGVSSDLVLMSENLQEVSLDLKTTANRTHTIMSHVYRIAVPMDPAFIRFNMAFELPQALRELNEKEWINFLVSIESGGDTISVIPGYEHLSNQERFSLYDFDYKAIKKRAKWDKRLDRYMDLVTPYAAYVNFFDRDSNWVASYIDYEVVDTSYYQMIFVGDSVHVEYRVPVALDMNEERSITDFSIHSLVDLIPVFHLSRMEELQNDTDSLTRADPFILDWLNCKKCVSHLGLILPDDYIIDLGDPVEARREGNELHIECDTIQDIGRQVFKLPYSERKW